MTRKNLIIAALAVLLALSHQVIAGSVSNPGAGFTVASTTCSTTSGQSNATVMATTYLICAAPNNPVYVELPASPVIGVPYTIEVDGTKAIFVYPASGGTIDSGAANASFEVGTPVVQVTYAVTFIETSPGTWKFQGYAPQAEAGASYLIDSMARYYEVLQTFVAGVTINGGTLQDAGGSASVAGSGTGGSSGQSTCTAMTGDINIVTSGGSTSAVCLTAGVFGIEYITKNAVANTVYLCPHTAGGAIGANSAGTCIAMTTQHSYLCTAPSASQYYCHDLGAEL